MLMLSLEINALRPTPKDARVCLGSCNLFPYSTRLKVAKPRKFLFIAP
jgi:hypothetical protein